MENSHSILQFKNGTEAELASANPILAKAEMVFESDTNKIKFGDGETRYNDLPYIGGCAGSGAASSFKYGRYKLSAAQTTSLTAGNHIEFDTKESGSLAAPSTGSGQQKGIITLEGGKSYKISMDLQTTHNPTGCVEVQLYDRTNDVVLKDGFGSVSFNHEGGGARTFDMNVIISPAQNIDVEMRFSFVHNFVAVGYECTALLIEEYGGY